MATDCRGNLYVADTGNDRVQTFGESGTPPPPCIGPAPLGTAPPPSAKPSNVLRFGSLKRSAKSGTALLVVRVPGAGRLVLTGKGLQRVVKTIKRAGKVRLRIKATGRAKQRLDKRGQVSFKAALRFTPTGRRSQHPRQDDQAVEDPPLNMYGSYSAASAMRRAVQPASRGEARLIA